jgi:hypothetical protein
MNVRANHVTLLIAESEGKAATIPLLVTNALFKHCHLSVTLTTYVFDSSSCELSVNHQLQHEHYEPIA